MDDKNPIGAAEEEAREAAVMIQSLTVREQEGLLLLIKGIAALAGQSEVF